MYILLPVIFLLLFVILPVQIKIDLNAKLKKDKIELEPLLNMKNGIKIKLFKFITVYKVSLFKKNSKATKKRKIKYKIIKFVIKTLKIDSIYLSLGINTYNYILNSYLNALLNTTICIYINGNEEKFNFEKLYYQIYTSCEPIVVNLELITSVSAIKVLWNIIKIKYLDKIKSFKNNFQLFLKNE